MLDLTKCHKVDVVVTMIVNCHPQIERFSKKQDTSTKAILPLKEKSVIKRTKEQFLFIYFFLFSQPSNHVDDVVFARAKVSAAGSRDADERRSRGAAQGRMPSVGRRPVL
jgi:hypothetical protein